LNGFTLTSFISLTLFSANRIWTKYFSANGEKQLFGNPGAHLFKIITDTRKNILNSTRNTEILSKGTQEHTDSFFGPIRMPFD
jgi:hypothetical protein